MFLVKITCFFGRNFWQIWGFHLLVKIRRPVEVTRTFMSKLSSQIKFTIIHIFSTQWTEKWLGWRLSFLTSRSSWTVFDSPFYILWLLSNFKQSVWHLTTQVKLMIFVGQFFSCKPPLQVPSIGSSENFLFKYFSAPFPCEQ